MLIFLGVFVVVGPLFYEFLGEMLPICFLLLLVSLECVLGLGFILSYCSPFYYVLSCRHYSCRFYLIYPVLLNNHQGLIIPICLCAGAMVAAACFPIRMCMLLGNGCCDSYYFALL